GGGRSNPRHPVCGAPRQDGESQHVGQHDQIAAITAVTAPALLLSNVPTASARTAETASTDSVTLRPAPAAGRPRNSVVADPQTPSQGRTSGTVGVSSSPGLA